MNSAMVKSRTNLPPLRETTLIVTIANHPALGVEHFEDFASLELVNPILQKMQSALLNIFAQFGERGEQASLEDVRNGLEAQGVLPDMEMLSRQVRENRIWQALENAAFEDARDGWQQAYALHVRSGMLRHELKVAERSFADIGDEASYERLVSVQKEIALEDGIEALIDGFGTSSGRPARNF